MTSVTNSELLKSKIRLVDPRLQEQLSLFWEHPRFPEVFEQHLHRLYHAVHASAQKSSATGGGVSEVFAAQTWQTQYDIDIRSANNKKAGRVIPDKLAANGGLFNDITQGHNKPVLRYPGYRARTGFDACTGWGTPLASNLVQALADLR